MKKTTLLFALSAMLFSSLAIAQNVGINETGTPGDASAGLDVDFDNKGFLLPRVALTSTTNQTPIGAPANSLMVYNTATAGDVTPGFYYWNGTIWKRFAETGDAWIIDGNAGTNAGTNFLGTTDNVALRIRTNNINRFEFTTNGRLRSFNAGTSAAPTYSWTADSDIGMYRITTNTLGFSTSGIERIRLQPNGNVGINVIPNANNNSLSSDQNTTTGTAGWFNTTVTSNWVTLEASNTSTIDGTGVSGMGYTGVSGQWTSTFGWAGYFTGDVNSTTGYYNISDERFKENISEINSNQGTTILDLVMQLRPKSYKFKSEEFQGIGADEYLHFGFIAQELKSVFPNVVRSDKKIPNPEVKREPNTPIEYIEGYYSVNYIELIPVLTKAIQEQQNEIESLEERVKQLEDIILNNLNKE